MSKQNDVVIVYSPVAMEIVVKFQPMETQPTNQISLSRQCAPSCYCDPELTTHTRIQ